MVLFWKDRLTAGAELARKGGKPCGFSGNDDDIDFLVPVSLLVVTALVFSLSFLFSFSWLARLFIEGGAGLERLFIEGGPGSDSDGVGETRIVIIVSGRGFPNGFSKKYAAKCSRVIILAR